ncbi:MAG: hypothetical protein HQ509_11055 [Candidatus Marinimicrobia bacterium]|nr:hypothetical protein [Candidatus Neomarinimicrobiota bacterium]
MNRLYLIGPIALLLISTCSKTPDLQDTSFNILAQIGENIITKEDFIRRAEYVIRPDYCKGTNYIHKKIILNSLIAEKLFALEGRQIGILEGNDKFTHFIQGRKEQAMRQWYYYDQVFKQVKLDTSQIQSAYRLAGRTINVAYYILPTEEFSNQAIQALSDEFTFEDIYTVLDTDETIPKKEINWFDREDPIIMDQLFNSSILKGNIIGPLTTADGSILLMKVEGWIDRSVMTETDVTQRWDDVVERLTEQKAMKVYEKNVAELMRGKTMLFNENIFKQYVAYMADHYLTKQTEKENILNQAIWNDDTQFITAGIGEFPFEQRKEHLVQVDSRWWDVDEFESILQSHPLVFRKKKMNRKEFPVEFQKAVADLFQDIELTKLCYQLQYEKLATIRQNVALWEDHYIARDYRTKILEKTDAFKDSLSSTVETIENVLNPVVDSLQTKYSYQIKIDTDLFESIELTSIDMMVLQPQMPYPVVVPTFPVFTTDSRLDYGTIIESVD